MNAVSSDTPLASFESKWTAAQPEFGLALKFVTTDERGAQSAFACLVHELEYAAFGIREAQPAAIKLQWWAEEFTRAGTGEARHPLTQTLAGQPGFAEIALPHWHAVIVGALAQRDAEPAADRAALLATYAALYQPLATIEARLFAPLDAAVQAHLRTLSRALRETAALADALRDGRLPVPLDLLARHRLARGDLVQTSPQQAAALGEWLRALAAEFAQAVSADARLGVLSTASASADHWRAHTAARANDPLAALHAALARVPMRTVWATWRAGRRSRG